MHAIQNAKDVDRRIDNGALDALLDAQRLGKIRHLGFTGHNSPTSHLRMLERLEQMGIELDTCQMPINIVDPHHMSFIEQVLPKLLERNYGVLAMKSLAFGQLLGRKTAWANRTDNKIPSVIPDVIGVEGALSFVWSMPISSLVSGITTYDELRANAATLRNFTPMDQPQRLALLEKTAYAAGSDMEFYKAPGVP
jgi:predicted aldo/keto reductase-like oxidoreductase